MPHIPAADGLCDYCKRVPDEQECAIRLRGTLNVYLKWVESLDSDPCAIATDVVARFYGVKPEFVRFSSSREHLHIRNMAIQVALFARAEKQTVASYFDMTETHVSRVVHTVNQGTAKRLSAKVAEVMARRPQ